MIEFSSQKSENAATLAPPPVWFVLETMTYAPPEIPYQVWSLARRRYR